MTGYLTGTMFTVITLSNRTASTPSIKVGLPITMKHESIVFSIIIPFKSWSSNLGECLEHIQKHTFGRIEVILLPDKEITHHEVLLGLPISTLSSGRTSKTDKPPPLTKYLSTPGGKVLKPGFVYLG